MGVYPQVSRRSSCDERGQKEKGSATWLGVLQGLLTPVIAAIALYIAWQQWKANERKLVLDRYERRLRVYQRVVEFLSLVLRDFKPEPHEVMKFRGDTAEADSCLVRRFPLTG
jgi:hypothetical protein